MGKLISMKSKKGSKADSPVGATEDSKYPWGLSLTLEDEALKKLGVDFSVMRTGVKVGLVCEAEVTGRAENEYDGKINRSVNLQITKMAKPAASSRMKAGSNLLKQMRKEK